MKYYFYKMSDQDIRIVHVSSELFWGYRVKINIRDFQSVGEIIQFVRNDLQTYLKNANLIILVEKLDETHFHIHEPFSTYDDLLNIEDNRIVIYICDHCFRVDDET